MYVCAQRVAGGVWRHLVGLSWTIDLCVLNTKVASLEDMTSCQLLIVVFAVILIFVCPCPGQELSHDLAEFCDRMRIGQNQTFK